MQKTRSELGVLGEELAANFLLEKKWRIIERNFKLPWNDEIDIIAYDTEKVLVFVEVKTTSNYMISSEEQMTKKKISKCMRAAQWFANKNYKLIGESGWRIDCVSIFLKNGNYQISHYTQIV